MRKIISIILALLMVLTSIFVVADAAVPKAKRNPTIPKSISDSKGNTICTYHYQSSKKLLSITTDINKIPNSAAFAPLEDWTDTKMNPAYAVSQINYYSPEFLMCTIPGVRNGGLKKIKYNQDVYNTGADNNKNFSYAEIPDSPDGCFIEYNSKGLPITLFHYGESVEITYAGRKVKGITDWITMTTQKGNITSLKANDDQKPTEFHYNSKGIIYAIDNIYQDIPKDDDTSTFVYSMSFSFKPNGDIASITIFMNNRSETYTVNY